VTLWHDEPLSRIEDYALLADLQTAALVSRNGSIAMALEDHPGRTRTG
jgi:hypothetical protein